MHRKSAGNLVCSSINVLVAIGIAPAGKNKTKQLVLIS